MYLAGLGVFQLDLCTTRSGPELSRTAARILMAPTRKCPGSWVLFDLNGTLLDPSRSTSSAVAASTRRNTMAMVTVIAGAEAYVQAAARGGAAARLERAGAILPAALLDRLAEMPCLPGRARGAARLREAGHRLAVLTQSAAESAETVPRQRRHPRALRARPISAPDFGAFKPEDLRFYHAALERCGRLRRGSWPATGGTSRAPPTPVCARPDLLH